jgi:hypothetical protein
MTAEKNKYMFIFPEQKEAKNQKEKISNKSFE